MRRITLWLLSTVSALVLLFSYHTSTGSAASTSIVAQSGADSGTASGDGSATSGSGSSGSSSSSGSSDDSSGSSGSAGSSDDSGSSSGSSGSSGSSSSAAKAYSGDAVSTRFGDVQVEITVKDGKVTKAAVLKVPWSNGRDQEINSYAVPILNSEVVDAQSATIDMVSGATYTSQGYIGSLQSAIDQANL